MTLTLFLLGGFFSLLALLALAAHRLVMLSMHFQAVKQQLDKLKQEMRALCNGSVGIGQRVLDMESRLDHLASEQDKATKRTLSLSSYQHAAQLVRIGGRVEDIVQGCGLTPEEAELLMIMHRQQESTLPHLGHHIEPVRATHRAPVREHACLVE